MAGHRANFGYLHFCYYALCLNNVLLYYILSNTSPFLFSFISSFHWESYTKWSCFCSVVGRFPIRNTAGIPIILLEVSLCLPHFLPANSRWCLRLSREFLPSTAFIFHWQITLLCEAVEYVLMRRDHVFSIRSKLRDGRSGFRVFSSLNPSDRHWGPPSFVGRVLSSKAK